MSSLSLNPGTLTRNSVPGSLSDPKYGSITPGIPLTTDVLDSDANSFTVTNRIFNSGNALFIVSGTVKDSDGNNFIVFT
jgi:hypothetical protein